MDDADATFRAVQHYFLDLVSSHSLIGLQHELSGL